MPNIIDITHKYKTAKNWQQRTVSQIQKLVVHHSAADSSDNPDARLQEIMNWHLRNDGGIWPGLSYHYCVFKNGNIYKTNNHSDLTWHDGVNFNSLGILVDGYFHAPINNQPTPQQLESLEWLLTELATKHPEFPAGNNPLQDIVGHRDQMATACPGDILYPKLVEIKQRINQKITNSQPPITPSTPSSPLPEPDPNQAEIDLTVELIKQNDYIDQKEYLFWVENKSVTPIRILQEKEAEFAKLNKKYNQLENDYFALQTKYDVLLNTPKADNSQIGNAALEIQNIKLQRQLVETERKLAEALTLSSEKWSWSKFFVGLSRNATLLTFISNLWNAILLFLIAKYPELATQLTILMAGNIGLTAVSAAGQNATNKAKAQTAIDKSVTFVQ